MILLAGPPGRGVMTGMVSVWPTCRAFTSVMLLAWAKRLHADAVLLGDRAEHVTGLDNIGLRCAPGGRLVMGRIRSGRQFGRAGLAGGREVVRAGG